MQERKQMAKARVRVKWRRVEIPVPNDCKGSPDGVHKLNPDEKKVRDTWPVKGFPNCRKRMIAHHCDSCNTDLTTALLFNKEPPEGPTLEQVLGIKSG
jgi:hypothetical protein